MVRKFLIMLSIGISHFNTVTRLLEQDIFYANLPSTIFDSDVTGFTAIRILRRMTSSYRGSIATEHSQVGIIVRN